MPGVRRSHDAAAVDVDCFLRALLLQLLLGGSWVVVSRVPVRALNGLGFGYRIIGFRVWG